MKLVHSDHGVQSRRKDDWDGTIASRLNPAHIDRIPVHKNESNPDPLPPATIGPPFHWT